MRRTAVIYGAILLGAMTGVARPASSQAAPVEITEMRRRIGIIRAELPAITDAAEVAADLFTRNVQSRLLISKSWDLSFYSEMVTHGGGPVGLEDADGANVTGITLIPVRNWDGQELRTSFFADRQLSRSRMSIVIGSRAGAPRIAIGQKQLDNGAPDGTAAHSVENALANTIVAWTFINELVAAASRHGWHPGILLSSLVPGSTTANNALAWRMPDTVASHQIPPGSLGLAYLAELDRVLLLSTEPPRVAAVTRVASALKSVVASGGTVFVGSCMHWMIEELAADSVARGGVRGIDWRWDPEAILTKLTKPTDALVWFGYGGTDCPHVQPATIFRELRRPTAVVAGPDAAKAENDFLWIPQGWRLPDAAAALPFAPGSMGPVATIEAGITWLWLKRLISAK